MALTLLSLNLPIIVKPPEIFIFTAFLQPNTAENGKIAQKRPDPLT
jgi:hypothetical protein